VGKKRAVQTEKCRPSRANVGAIITAARVKSRKAKAEKGSMTEKEIRAWDRMVGGPLTGCSFGLNEDRRWRVERPQPRALTEKKHVRIKPTK